MQRVATVVLVAILQACTLGPDSELALEVDSSDPAVVAQTADVLAARFDEALPSMFSSLTFAIDGSTIRFTFKNGAPEPKILERLYQTPGHLRAALATQRFGSPWLTERDVVDVTLFYRNSMYGIAVRLSTEAGQRLVRLTTENVGQVVTMTLDGETLLEARIQGVFGERFEIVGTQQDVDFYGTLRAILTNGALPADVKVAPADTI